MADVLPAWRATLIERMQRVAAGYRELGDERLADGAEAWGSGAPLHNPLIEQDVAACERVLAGKLAARGVG